MRQSSGLAEQKVWRLLRAGRIDGHKFRRQFAVGPYYADFACDALRLIIEIDGGIHTLDDVAVSDHYRQAELEALGWTVVRFTNEQALHGSFVIVEAIRDHARNISPGGRGQP